MKHFVNSSEDYTIYILPIGGSLFFGYMHNSAIAGLIIGIFLAIEVAMYISDSKHLKLLATYVSGFTTFVCTALALSTYGIVIAISSALAVSTMIAYMSLKTIE